MHPLASNRLQEVPPLSSSGILASQRNASRERKRKNISSYKNTYFNLSLGVSPSSGMQDSPALTYFLINIIVLLRGAPLVARIVHFNVALRRHRGRQFHFLDSDLFIF